MLLIKGEHFNTESNLFDQVKISSESLVGILYGLYEENDCDSIEEFLGYIKDESILIYITKKGE